MGYYDEYYISGIETKLYNSEYGENILITCTLPAPLFLHMTNINQMIQNTKEYVQSIADYEYEADEYEKCYYTSNCDLKGATNNQVTTIEDILTELPKIYKELTTNDSGTITKYQLNRLKVLAKACEGWNLDEFEVVEDEV